MSDYETPIKGIKFRVESARVEPRGPIKPSRASKFAAMYADTAVMSFTQWENSGKIGIEPRVRINVDTDGLRCDILLRRVPFADGLEWRNKHYSGAAWQMRIEEAMKQACIKYGHNEFGVFIFADPEHVWISDQPDN